MTFESFLAADRPDPATTRLMRRALVIALAVHVAALVAAVVHAGWRVDEVAVPPPPTVMITLSTPPPPGEPAAEQRPRPARVRKTARATRLVQPQDKLVAQVPAETSTSPSEGPPDSPPGDPDGDCIGADCRGPSGGTGHFVAPAVASGRLAIDPHAEPYRVKLPPALNRAGMRLWLLAKLCVRPDGTVERVALLKGADPALDPLAVATLRTWRYRPYSVNGRPVPFCTNVRYEIATQ